MLEEIHDDLLTHIIRRVGLSDFRDLRGVIGANKRCKSVALSSAMLKETDLFEVLWLGHHIDQNSPYHLFLARCIHARNQTAVLMEGLRLGFMEEKLDEAIRRVETCNGTSVYMVYVLGMLQICGDDHDIGCTTLAQLKWWEDIP
ncbi:unnamed protein product [Arabis nemorensis]|uniref:F-box domain-containing protein n=1 Tax=Arabis nemorensis TaxID=586526 RepID=A0A565CMW7_9BRAS|nr:unnamed protein product [Arabis nemorensis]